MKNLLRFPAMLLVMCALSARAQGQDGTVMEKRDSIKAAVKTGHIKVARDLGHLGTGMKGIRGVVSPLGEGDPIKWAQGLPGVTTGADGTTAIFIRGGNMGNNLITLDGVPVYGFSHILGLTTVVPQSMLLGATVSKSGFDGSESNFTAGHVRMESRAPEEGLHAEASVNNFLVSASAEGSWKRLSGMLSLRVSPLTYEYAAVKGLLPRIIGGLDKFRSGVGDMYGKLRFSMDDQTYMELSGLKSSDRYSVSLGEESDETFGWGNTIGIFKFHRDGAMTVTDFTTSYNVYDSFQTQDKLFRGVMNHLSLHSDLKEFTMAFNQDNTFGMRRMLGLGYGARFNHLSIAPGQRDGTCDATSHFLTNMYLQPAFRLHDVLSLKGFIRGSFFSGMLDQQAAEFGASAKVRVGKHLDLQATYDDISQFYHTLEGLPTGWSLDMIVPSGEHLVPERSRQVSIGFSSETGNHSLSVAGFGKRMDDLVYFRYSQTLFSGALSDWMRSGIDTGSGDAYGGEFLYEYQKEGTYVRVGYTLSKTNRHGFKTINDGAEFHARFDRRHVLNATVTWRDFSAALTWQSGNWENGASEKYIINLMPDGTFTGDYFSTVNNYHMPPVFRLDLGYRHSFTRGRLRHEVSLGVCNLTNHFNPFMLYFDTSDENWKGLCLLPILPNFNWRVEF